MHDLYANDAEGFGNGDRPTVFVDAEGNRATFENAAFGQHETKVGELTTIGYKYPLLKVKDLDGSILDWIKDTAAVCFGGDEQKVLSAMQFGLRNQAANHLRAKEIERIKMPTNKKIVGLLQEAAMQAMVDGRADRAMEIATVLQDAGENSAKLQEAWRKYVKVDEEG